MPNLHKQVPDNIGINAHVEERNMPRYSFTAPAFMDIGANAADAVSAPIKLIALSGGILDRPEWGPCIQDLSGMQHKERIAVDYRHNGDEVLGYINQFDITDGTLQLSGALVPQKTHSRTQEILDNMRMGVPYEASVYFPPSSPGELEIEEIEPGQTALVNGKQVTAPEKGLTIFRKWSLRGVAICPHGADAGTAAYLQTSQAAVVSVLVSKVPKMEEQRMNKQQVVDLLGGISKETDAVKFMQTLSDIAAQAEDADQKKLASDALTSINAESDPAKKSTIAADVLAKFGFKAEVDASPVAKDAKKEEVEEKKTESYSLEDVKKFGKKFGGKAQEYMEKGLSYVEALESFADFGRKGMEAAAEAEAKAKQEAAAAVGHRASRPAIQFQSTDGIVQDSDASKYGLSEKEVEAIGAYAQAFGLSDKAKQRIMEKHTWARKESRRIGVYTPDVKAAAFDQGSTSMTKIGIE